jgi:hypothetical protein
MTVDLLAATFFWPEATMLGAQPSLVIDGEEPNGASEAECDDLDRAESASFWSILLRSLKGQEPTAAKPS